MKRILTALCGAAMLIALCACGARTEGPAQAAVSETMPAQTSAPTPEPTPVQTLEPNAPPVLSEGAAEASGLSGLVGAGADGTVYTSLVRAEGAVCLYDLLPEDAGYIAGFAVTDAGIFVVLRDDFFSLEPAALYRLGGDGGLEPVAEEVATSGVFCIAGGDLFYEAYYGGLVCVDMTTGQTRAALPEEADLLAADGGFIYYYRDGAVYRNDSTMAAETRLFEAAGVGGMFSGADGLCDLVYRDGAAVIELREPNGVLRGETALEESADHIAFANGRIYAPQREAKTIAVLDAGDGSAVDTLAIPVMGSYCTIHFVADGALYYETFSDGAGRLYRLALDGSGAEEVGELLMF